MKKILACALFVSFLTFQLAAANAHEDRCRQLTTFSTLSQAKQVENDLVGGIWSLRSENFRSTFEFNANGIASLITESQGDLHYEDVLWNVTTLDHSVVLSVTNPEQDTKHYSVVQNCDGVLLKSLNDHDAQQWMFEKPMLKYEYQTMEMQLVGVWKSISGSEDATTTKYQFKKDGTLLIVEAGIQTPGVWDLTEDGQYILVTLQNNAGVYFEHFALRIYDIDYHTASFTLNGKGGECAIQYFEKI
jgi:hypothetical protein